MSRNSMSQSCEARFATRVLSSKGVLRHLQHITYASPPILHKMAHLETKKVSVTGGLINPFSVQRQGKCSKPYQINGPYAMLPYAPRRQAWCNGITPVHQEQQWGTVVPGSPTQTHTVHCLCTHTVRYDHKKTVPCFWCATPPPKAKTQTLTEKVRTKHNTTQPNRWRAKGTLAG